MGTEVCLSLLQAAAQVFAPFGQLNPFHISEYANPAWMTAKAGFESRMVPIERRISQQLQEALRTTILPALTAAVAQHADRASGAVMQPSQASLVISALQLATVPCVVVPHHVWIVLPHLCLDSFAR